MVFLDAQSPLAAQSHLAAQLPVAATVSSSARPNGSKKPVRRKVVNRQDIEEHFPMYFTATAPHCAICLSEVQESEPCRKTTCKHEFHAECIMKWWTKERGTVLNCPTCREPQKVSVKKIKQVNTKTQQKGYPSPTGHSLNQAASRRSLSQPGRLGRLFESVRRALPRPLGTPSHDGRTTAALSQEASQIPNDTAVRQPISQEDGTPVV